MYHIKNLEPGPAWRDSMFGNTTATNSAAHNDIIDEGTRTARLARGALRGACAGLTAKVEAARFCRAPPRRLVARMVFLAHPLLETTFEGQMRSKRRECSCLPDYKAV